MDVSERYLCELIGEKAASDIHAEIANELNTFIGHLLLLYIEKNGIILLKKFIDDEDTKEDRVDGGYIQLPDGTCFIFVNTKRNLREQLFTIAHEYWHHIEEKYINDLPILQKNEISERAADRFAASLTMNDKIVKALFNRLINSSYSLDEIIYFIADLSVVPYISVLRRIEELELFDELKEIHKMDRNPFIKNLLNEFKNYCKLLTKSNMTEFDLENHFIQKRQEKLGYIHPLDSSDEQELIFTAYDNVLRNIKEQKTLVDRKEKMIEIVTEEYKE